MKKLKDFMEVQSANLTINDAKTEFIKSKKILGVSDATLKNYEFQVNKFIEFTSQTLAIKDIDINVINNFILALKESNPNLSAISIKTAISNIRTFIYFCMNKEYCDSFKIHLPKANKPLKECYTDDELKKLLKKPNLSICTFAEYRNWLIIQMLISTGMRASNIGNILISDIDFENCAVALKTSKTGKSLFLPLSEKFLSELNKYVLQFRKSSKSDDFLFITENQSKITVDCLKTTITRYNKKRGVSKTSIHLFRHTFAKNWIIQGGNIFILQKILGHSSLEMVKNYANIYQSDLFGNDKFNLFSRLSNNTLGKIKMR